MLIYVRDLVLCLDGVVAHGPVVSRDRVTVGLTLATTTSIVKTPVGCRVPSQCAKSFRYGVVGGV